ncbi:hypothetical protein Poly51_57900 [Rubripirellula tenax]|uniref:DUF7691 domain-containing protein n=1 Tax=Rubripirellula tenax TaxID=2528015 RepID=A0A5C6EAE5_9BACT|nr:hypothetical protein [Rubripirellula tenax]TWU44741.1 hypothetical protein Poly51_57900 [Rubripirellula tenax]
MRYSIYFFAMNASQVAEQFSNPSTLLDQMADRLREANEFTEDEVKDSLKFASQICACRLPDDCGTDYFNALCWLCEVASEKVEIPGFTLLRSHGHIDDIGIWHWFQSQSPPFAVPTCSDRPPEVGYLANSDIESIVLPALEEADECTDEEAESARTNFHEVVESVHEDGLDLLAVMLCS